MGSKQAEFGRVSPAHDVDVQKFITMGQSHTSMSGPREGVKRINDCLYELYAPPGVPEVEIVFVHGLQPFDYRNAHWQTWLSKASQSNELWPQTWLPRDFKNARILTVSYDSSAQQGSASGRSDMYTIGESLMHNIILSSQSHIGQSPNCPVIFVGHSLGGLVIKQLILFAKSKLDRWSENREQRATDVAKLKSFFENIKGVFYFATPHIGSNLADLKKMTDSLKVFPQNSEVLKFLTVLNNDAARQNDEFREWRKNNNVKAWSVIEMLPTRLSPGFWAKVVEEGSARHDADNYMPVQENHISICKLEDTTSVSYQFLTDFITQCTGLSPHVQGEEALIV